MRDMATTTATSILTIIFLIFTVRFLTIGLGPEEFGAYSLARRILTMLEPITTLCMSFALTRYAAISNGKDESYNYFFPSFLLVLLVSSLLMILIFIFNQEIAGLIFAGPNYKNLTNSLAIMLFFYSIYIVIYSFYRGIGLMNKANFWQILLIGLGPFLIAYFFSSKGAATVLFYMAVLTGFSLVPLFIELTRMLYRKAYAFKQHHIKKLVIYGLPRVPGIFAYNALFAVGPFFSAYSGAIKGSGFILIGQLLLRMVEGGMEAFSRVAFPKIAEMFEKTGKSELEDKVNDLIEMILQVGIFMTFQLYIWSTLLINLWLGNEFEEATTSVKIISLSLLPYLAFILLRNIVDAINIKAYITYYLFFSLSLSIVGSLISILLDFGVEGHSWSFVVGVYCMSILTFYRIAKDFRVNLKIKNFLLTLLFNIALIAVSLIFSRIFLDLALISQLIGIIFSGLGLVVIYTYFLHSINTIWLKRIVARITSL